MSAATITTAQNSPVAAVPKTTTTTTTIKTSAVAVATTATATTADSSRGGSKFHDKLFHTKTHNFCFRISFKIYPWHDVLVVDVVHI